MSTTQGELRHQYYYAMFNANEYQRKKWPEEEDALPDWCFSHGMISKKLLFLIKLYKLTYIQL